MKNIIRIFTTLKLIAYLAAIAISIFTEYRFFYVLVFPLLLDIPLHIIEGQIVKKAGNNKSIQLFLNRDKVGFPWLYAGYLIVFIVFMIVDYEDLHPVPFLLVFIAKIADSFFGAIDWSAYIQNDSLTFKSAFAKTYPISDVSKVLIKSDDKAVFRCGKDRITSEFRVEDLTALLNELGKHDHIEIKRSVKFEKK